MNNLDSGSNEIILQSDPQNKDIKNSEIELRPKKCTHCGSSDLENQIEYYCKYGLEEYVVMCKNCSAIVGHWAFGSWLKTNND